MADKTSSPHITAGTACFLIINMLLLNNDSYSLLLFTLSNSNQIHA
jgi:hypothetical protein